ncbi:hypothetical protein HY933_00545 [Candidatus Falkowbacteria bacterium]|nr:hypothetical protein [Candidatus Falkowbacteria bacterium]
MWLLIKTIDRQRLTFMLSDGQRVVRRMSRAVGQQQAEQLLLSLDKFLRDGGYALAGLRGVVVVSGAGSFTALRLGVILGNTLGYVLDIPVVAINAGEMVEAEFLSRIRPLSRQRHFAAVPIKYSSTPHITQSKQ